MTIFSFQARSLSVEENPGWLKALFLKERLTSIPIPQNFEATEKAKRKFQKWKEQGPFNKDGYFKRRLESDNLSEADFLFLLDETSQDLRARLPEIPTWLREIDEAFAENTRLVNPDGSEASDLGTAGMPFALVPLKPLINRGINRLQGCLTNLSQKYPDLPFDPAIVKNLFLPALFDQLVYRISRTFALEVNVARMEGRLQGETSQARFNNFIINLQQDKAIMDLLQEYPVLARQLVLIIGNWVNFTGEFLTRLTEDWSLIAAEFGQEKTAKLAAAKTGNGDNHRGGRSVVKAEFDNGFRIIYKPKSLAGEIHFQELLEWLNERGFTPAFRSLKIIDRHTHGWEEFVVAETCTGEEQIRRFYRRQGAYLALLYALDTTDIHHENLIAAGEHPMLVDLEALFHPRVFELKPNQNWQAASNRMSYSVMRTGLLPDRIFVQGKGQGMDISGLGSKPGQLSPRPVALWEGSGTDQVRLVRQQVEMEGSENLPGLNGAPVNILDYSAELSGGFENLYRLLLKHRDELLAGPLQAFRQDEVRVILRNTTTYLKLLSESFHPDFLRDGLDRDRFFDHLWATTEVEPYLAKVIPSELEDLHGGDVPVFNTRPGSRDIYDSRGRVIENFLVEASYEAVRRRIEQMGEDDLAWQTWFIKASLATVERPEKLDRKVKPDYQDYIHAQAPSRQELLAEALQMGDTLAKQALVNGENVNWVGLTLINESAWSILPSGLDLYSGTPGIALFLAYLGAISGKPLYTELAQKALNTIQHEAKHLKKTDFQAGAFEGLSGLIYLYTHLGYLWKDQSLYREAVELAAQLPQLLQKDETLDVIGGTAGAILSLLSLYKVYPEQGLLDTAVLAGQRLLEKAISRTTGLAWESSSHKDIFLTGFSHGAAGYAYSLLSLAQASGNESFRKTALAAMEYERSLFSQEHQNWPDLRESAAHGPDYVSTWCHGAPGIALGRLASLPLLDDPATRAEIEAGLATTIKEGFGYNHSLCHGDLGNLEPLLLASQLYPVVNYTTALNAISRMVLESLKKDGPISGIPMQVETPGLMTGLAGIGYGLLRLAAPERVPSVLILASPHRP